MTYAEFKELGFPGIMPMENVLAQALWRIGDKIDKK